MSTDMQSNIFKQRLMSVFHIWKQEYLNIMREPGVLIIFFAATLLYPLLYGIIYGNEVLREIPVAVIDMSQSSMSRKYIQALDATPELYVAFKPQSLKEAEELFYRHQIHGIIFISSDFDKNIYRGTQSFVSVYLDMSSFLYYKATLTAVSIVSREVGAQIQYQNLLSTGLTTQQAAVSVNPLPCEGMSIFNGGGGFGSFLLPAVFILIFYQTLILGINMLAGVYWEENRYKNLIIHQNRRFGTLDIVFGKGFCYFSLYMVLAFYLTGLIPRIYNLPHIGNGWTLFLFMIPFLLSTTFLAMTISIFMRNMESAFLLLLFSTLPLLFLAGASWPQSGIPAFWKAVSYLFPSTHGIQGYIRINTMNAGLNEVAKEYFILWLETGVYFLTACLVYDRLIKKSRAK
ncbi:MAG: ABC transporter permease [Candidatus Azobacteroides sp.]|nr:ABC transporter permease [Candidatus Azobacteroides sp.]